MNRKLTLLCSFLVLCACDAGFKEDTDDCGGSSSAVARAERNFELYRSIEGVYQGDFDRGTSNYKSPVELRLVAALDSEGQDNCGRPLPKATITGQIRREDAPSWLDYVAYRVVFIEETRQLSMVYEVQAEDSSDRIFRNLDGVIRTNGTFEGVYTSRNGREGVIKARQVSKKAVANPEGQDADLRERLTRAYAPYVGYYQGNFSQSRIPNYNNINLGFNLYIDPTGPALRIQIRYLDSDSLPARLTSVDEFRPDTGYLRFSRPADPNARIPGAGMMSGVGRFVQGGIQIDSLTDHRGDMGPSFAQKCRSSKGVDGIDTISNFTEAKLPKCD